MSEEECRMLRKEGAAALALMEQALELLDQGIATTNIAAHLDLAISRLRELVANAARPCKGEPGIRCS